VADSASLARDTARCDARVVLCTVPSEQVAEHIALTLLEERLVACVNVLPGVRSLYRWQGKVEDDRELLLLMKTQADRYRALEARVRELHPYEVCEVLALDVADGSSPYLAWLLAQTRP
jgi:periplasmic divalent cation tolerance protein